MQKIFSFNTIFQSINILLQYENNIFFQKNQEASKQSEYLNSIIDHTLSKFHLNYFDIDVYSTINGPGNFTNIKTNLAVIKALQISTVKKIIINDCFEIISFGQPKFDLTILDININKLYIKYNDNSYDIIHRNELQNFLDKKKDLIIVTNNKEFQNRNIIYSAITNEKWSELIYYKVSNEKYTNIIKPLYIEEAMVTKRKN